MIADHIRACAFLIVDGVLPSNEGRGYVLRRIIRRALRHGWMLGVRGEPFFRKLVAPLVAADGRGLPGAARRQRRSSSARCKAEEERFARDAGFRHAASSTTWPAARRRQRSIPGADAFRLYDTYGFPLDLTADIARERGLSVDVAGFDAAMDAAEAKPRAPPASSAAARTLPAELVAQLRAHACSSATTSWPRAACRCWRCCKDGKPVDAVGRRR